MIDGVNALSMFARTRDLGTLSVGPEAGPSATPPAAAANVGAPSFAETLGNMANDMVGTLKTAEQTSYAGIKGTADTREVVDAVMAAEQTLQTALAVRDKIVNAYLELSHMAI
jgi:flagellar hook-basal body complex protein FliE